MQTAVLFLSFLLGLVILLKTGILAKLVAAAQGKS